MNKVKTIVDRTIIVTITVVHTMFFPAFALAEGTTNTCPKTSGASAPTGSDSGMFTFNKESCLWQSQYYTYNPETKVKTPRYSQEYVTNPETGQKERTIWIYVASKGKYIARVETKPAPVSTQDQKNSSTEKPSTTSDSSSPQDESKKSENKSSSSSENSAESDGEESLDSATIDSTGADSENHINSSSDNDTTIDLGSGLTVTNNIDSYSGSGDVKLIGNTSGGDATSGDAENIAHILNLLQSSWDPSYGDIATFAADIYDYQGDLLLDSSAILNSGHGSSNSINDDEDNNLDVNIQNDGRIVNNVDLTSESGDATVAYNTKAGDATSGDASVQANIVNMLNSMISSPSSAIGTINIHGNFSGDILLPYLLNSISKTGANSSNSIANDNDTDIDINSEDNRRIVNNTNLGAESGDATSEYNTKSGNTTSGDAETNLNVYNMSGQEILGSRGLLVFTNVLGFWDGFLLDSLRGENVVFGTGADSLQTIKNTNDTSINIDSESNSSIENNVNLKAKSGDAKVVGNTVAGDATSGDATATANIFNLINSQLNFTEFFDIMIINVFGCWDGSFGRDTEVSGACGADNNKESGNVAADNKNKHDNTRENKKTKTKVGTLFASSNNGDKQQSPDDHYESYTESENHTAYTNSESSKKPVVKSDSTKDSKTKPKTDKGSLSQEAASSSLPLSSLSIAGIVGGVGLIGLERWFSLRGSRKK